MTKLFNIILLLLLLGYSSEANKVYASILEEDRLIVGDTTWTSKTPTIKLMGAFGASYGNQSRAIPPLQNKISVGLAASNDFFSFYFLPGITAGIAPVGSTHIESGMRLFFLTFDYSINWTTSGDGLQDQVDESVNVGVRFDFYRWKGSSETASIWLKAGKSISQTGYDAEYPIWWDGKNIELKVVIEGLISDILSGE